MRFGRSTPTRGLCRGSPEAYRLSSTGRLAFEAPVMKKAPCPPFPILTTSAIRVRNSSGGIGLIVGDDKPIVDVPESLFGLWVELVVALNADGN